MAARPKGTVKKVHSCVASLVKGLTLAYEPRLAVNIFDRSEYTKLNETLYQAHSLTRLVRAFLQAAQILPWGQQAAQRQGQLRAHLEAGGTPLHTYDLMIAAHALVEDLIVVTDNEKHFRRVPELRVENWLQ